MPHTSGVNATAQQVRDIVERAGGCVATRPEVIAHAVGVAWEQAVARLESAGLIVGPVGDGRSTIRVDIPSPPLEEDPHRTDVEEPTTSADDVPDNARVGPTWRRFQRHIHWRRRTACPDCSKGSNGGW